jgi:hypothetical protein
VTEVDRQALRAALLEAEPWLGEPDRGPRSVDAGPCDRCRELPRLLPTCGPSRWEALCRPCAVAAGLDAWCDGHRDDGREALRWAGALPAHWDVAVVLWWVATGELRTAELRTLRDTEGLPGPVRALLPATE